MDYVIKIVEQSGKDLTDYQVKVEITNPDFFSKCTDQKYIEFYDEDKQTLLSHYTELFDIANKIAVFWVKVPSIPANGTKMIYLNINTERTEDLSDPSKVFDLWDDFSGDSLDTTKWEVEFRGNSYNIQDGILHIDDSDSGNDKSLFYSKNTVDKPVIVEMRARGSNSRIGTLAVDKAQDFIRWHWITKDDHNSLDDYKYSDTTQRIEYYQVAFTTYENEWHYFKTIFNGDYAKGYVRNEQRGTESTVEYTFGRSLGTYQVGFACYATVMDVDWIKVRKYTEPEPCVTVIRLGATPTYDLKLKIAQALAGEATTILDTDPKIRLLSGTDIIKELSLTAKTVYKDATNNRVVVAFLFVDDSSDEYTADNLELLFTKDNTEYVAFKSSKSFTKVADKRLPLRWEIYLPYDVDVCTYEETMITCL